jgi:hypothetical protein
MSAVPVDMNQLETTNGSDFVFGTDGDDYAAASRGDDFIAAGDGNDVINGGAGDDNLLGEAGDDEIHGDEGDDFIDGYTGNNEISGGEGNDYVLTGTGNDVIDGGAGVDVIDYYLSPAGVDIDVTGGHSTNGQFTTDFTNIEAIVGSQHDDTYRFASPQADAEYFILGGQGNNTIDLSTFGRDELEVSDGVIRGPAGAGRFAIFFHNVSSVTFADGTDTFDNGSFRWPDEYRSYLPNGLANGLGLFAAEQDSQLIDGLGEYVGGDSGNGGDSDGGGFWPEGVIPPVVAVRMVTPLATHPQRQ